MYIDSITPEFILVFVSVLLAVLLIFPFIDYMGYRRARKEHPNRPVADDKVKRQ